jgi:hypothetical protein
MWKGKEFKFGDMYSVESGKPWNELTQNGFRSAVASGIVVAATIPGEPRPSNPGGIGVLHVLTQKL